jgi:acyl-coenzyme A thioesterase PaaI-like protein
MANQTLKIWNRLAGLPGGKALFSMVVCFKAPYFGSIRPRFVRLESGMAEVRMRKRRAVQNHIGTVHAIAMCNMAELAGGTMTDVTVSPAQRWIPKGMTVRYLKKAGSNLRAVATPAADLPETGESGDYPVRIEVRDVDEELVFDAEIMMWVSPKKPPQ